VTFALVARRRLIGPPFGTMASARRGHGSDVAGSRPYRAGDDMHAIDWGASALLSSARGTDEFVVRETYAEEAPRVVVVRDYRPSMAFYAPPLPWLQERSELRRRLGLRGGRRRRSRRRLRAGRSAAPSSVSWYTDATGRNSTLWPGSVRAYQRRLARFQPGDYLTEHPRSEPARREAGPVAELV